MLHSNVCCIVRKIHILALINVDRRRYTRQDDHPITDRRLIGQTFHSHKVLATQGSGNTRSWQHMVLATQGLGNTWSWQQKVLATQGPGNSRSWQHRILATQGLGNTRTWQEAQSASALNHLRKAVRRLALKSPSPWYRLHQQPIHSVFYILIFSNF